MCFKRSVFSLQDYNHSFRAHLSHGGGGRSCVGPDVRPELLPARRSVGNYRKYICETLSLRPRILQFEFNLKRKVSKKPRGSPAGNENYCSKWKSNWLVDQTLLKTSPIKTLQMHRYNLCFIIVLLSTCLLFNYQKPDTQTHKPAAFENPPPTGLKRASFPFLCVESRSQRAVEQPNTHRMNSRCSQLKTRVSCVTINRIFNTSFCEERQCTESKALKCRAGETWGLTNSLQPGAV